MQELGTAFSASSDGVNASPIAGTSLMLGLVVSMLPPGLMYAVRGVTVAGDVTESNAPLITGMYNVSARRRSGGGKGADRAAERQAA